jgi:hypothetical protein
LWCYLLDKVCTWLYRITANELMFKFILMKKKRIFIQTNGSFWNNNKNACSTDTTVLIKHHNMCKYKTGWWEGVWRLTPLPTIFQLVLLVEENRVPCLRQFEYATSWHDGGGDKHTKRLYVHDTRWVVCQRPPHWRRIMGYHRRLVALVAWRRFLEVIIV